MQRDVKHGEGQWEGPGAGVFWSCLMESQMFGVAKLEEPDGTWMEMRAGVQVCGPFRTHEHFGFHSECHRTRIAVWKVSSDEVSGLDMHCKQSLLGCVGARLGWAKRSSGEAMAATQLRRLVWPGVVTVEGWMTHFDTASEFWYCLLQTGTLGELFSL